MYTCAKKTLKGDATPALSFCFQEIQKRKIEGAERIIAKRLEEVKLASRAQAVIGDVGMLDAMCCQLQDPSNPMEYTFSQDVVFEGALAKIQESTGLASLMLVAAARMDAKPKVEFFQLTNKGEDGDDGPVYDEDNRPFYEGLCVQPLDDNLQPKECSQLKVPAKGHVFPISLGAADPWHCISWSTKSPRGAKGPAAAESSPSTGKRQNKQQTTRTKRNGAGDRAAGGSQKPPKQPKGSLQLTDMECSPAVDDVFAACVPDMLQLTQRQAEASLPAGEQEVTEMADVHDMAWMRWNR